MVIERSISWEVPAKGWVFPSQFEWLINLQPLKGKELPPRNLYLLYAWTLPPLPLHLFWCFLDPISELKLLASLAGKKPSKTNWIMFYGMIAWNGFAKHPVSARTLGSGCRKQQEKCSNTSPPQQKCNTEPSPLITKQQPKPNRFHSFASQTNTHNSHLVNFYTVMSLTMGNTSCPVWEILQDPVYNYCTLHGL